MTTNSTPAALENMPEAQRQYVLAQARIDGLIDQVMQFKAKHAAQAAKDSRNWGLLGDVQAAEMALTEALRVLGG